MTTPRSFAIALLTTLLVLTSFRAGLGEDLAERVARIEQGANGALRGLTVRNLEIAGNKIRVGKATLKTVGQQTTISGAISFQKNFMIPQIMMYAIKKLDGKVISIQLQFSAGSTAYIPKYVRLAEGRSYSAAFVHQIVVGRAAELDSRWQSAADLIVMTIALKAREAR